MKEKMMIKTMAILDIIEYDIPKLIEHTTINARILLLEYCDEIMFYINRLRGANYGFSDSAYDIGELQDLSYRLPKLYAKLLNDSGMTDADFNCFVDIDISICDYLTDILTVNDEIIYGAEGV